MGYGLERGDGIWFWEGYGDGWCMGGYGPDILHAWMGGQAVMMRHGYMVWWRFWKHTGEIVYEGYEMVEVKKDGEVRAALALALALALAYCVFRTVFVLDVLVSRSGTGV